MAYQALEGVLKLAKIPSVKVPISRLVPEAGSVQVTKPGVREDNECLQYRGAMTDGDLQSYWTQPFIVKSYIGYHSWPVAGGPQDSARMIHTAAHFALQPDTVRGLIAQFFLEETNMKTFVEFNSLEHEKGQDFFSTDRGLFLSFLLENVGPVLAAVFQPHIERLVSSPEESQQRAAAEMVYGLVRGSRCWLLVTPANSPQKHDVCILRFWDWESCSQLWSWLLPVFQQVLNNVTSETQSDWDFCFSGASNKADPNRLRWLYELLVTPENLVSQVVVVVCPAHCTVVTFHNLPPGFVQGEQLPNVRGQVSEHELARVGALLPHLQHPAGALGPPIQQRPPPDRRHACHPHQYGHSLGRGRGWQHRTGIPHQEALH